MVNMADIPQSFKIRPGTTDVGKDYEVKIAALLTLRCMNNSDIQNMWLVMNVNQCGAFDDIVLSFENSGHKNITYLIQLKHSIKSTVIKRREFTIEQGGFYIPKYYESIKGIKREIDVKCSKQSDFMKHLACNRSTMVYILFTTRSTTPKDNYLINVNKTSDTESMWLLHDSINTNGEIFSFRYKELNFVIENEYKEWMENFYLFTKQININKVDAVIQSYIENLIRPVKLSKPEMDELYQKFILFVTQWSKGDLGGFYPLTKTIILKVLFQHVIKTYMWNFEVDTVSNKISDVSFSLISKSVITIIEDDPIVDTFLKEHLYHVISNYCAVDKHKTLWKRHPEIVSKEINRTTGRYKSITMEAAYEYLWKTNQMPLILQVYKVESYNTLLKLLSVFQEIVKVIVLIKNVPDTSDSSALCFSMKDLSESDQYFVLNYPVKLQNRSYVKLSTFLKPEMFHLITMKDIIYILMNQYSIGNYPTEMPKIFIEQSFETIWLKSKVLNNATKDKFVIHYKSIDDLNAFLKKLNIQLESNEILTWQSNLNYEANQQYRIIFMSDVRNISKILDVFRDFNAHFLILHGHYNLEWIYTYGTIKNIVNFRKFITYNDLDNSISSSILGTVSRITGSGIKLIVGNPGIGKSTALTYIANHAPTDFWIVKIDLIDHIKYYKNTNNYKSHLDYFTASSAINNLSQLVLDFYIRSQKVMILFDGFDEIPMNFQKRVLKIICECRDLGCVIYLTSRTIMHMFLEESLQTFAYSITMFTQQNQMEYFTKYFMMNCEGSPDFNLIKNFTTNLLEAASENLNDQDKAFTGIPLQTKLLCEVFNNDCIKYLNTKIFENRYFDLIYLYKQFINKKISITCTKFGKGSDIFQHYKKYRTLYALQSIFSKHDLKNLNVEDQLNQLICMFPDTLHQIQKDGIVTVHNKTDVKFIHRTFAEYLSAKWLSKNIQSDDDDDLNREIALSLIKKIFAPGYITVRNMFDRLVAKNCSPHLAIINRQMKVIKTIAANDKKSLSALDKGARSIFHLIASNGVHHPVNKKTDELNELIRLDKMVSKDVMVDILYLLQKRLECNNDNIFNYTPVDYAIVSGSLHIGDIICSLLKDANNCITLPKLDIPYLSFYFNLFTYGCLSSEVIRHTVLLELENLLNQTYTREDTNLLHQAVQNENIADISELLSRDIDVNSVDRSGKISLHWAVIKGKPQTVSFLLTNSANVNACDHNGMTALHYLTITNVDNDIEIALLLLENQIDTLTKDNYGKTAMHYALHYNKQHIISCFINFQSKTTSLCNILLAVDTKGGSILHWAASKGDEDTVSLLLNHGADIEVGDHDRCTPLHWACQNGQLEMSKLLVSKGANINPLDDHGRTPLYFAADCNKLRLVTFLLSIGANTNEKDKFGRTALYQAILKNYEGIISVLLEREDMNVRDNEAMSIMHWAAWTGHQNIVNLLLSKKNNYELKDKYGRTPLICAAQYGHTTIVDTLLQNGANIQALDENDMNSLHWSCWNGHTEITRLLLSYLINIELKDNQGRSALHCCSHSGHTSSAYLLLLHGADVNTIDTKCMTPLNWASHNGHYETVKLLLEKNCSLDLKNLVGRTALSNAASNGHLKIVKLLLTDTSAIEEKDNEGMTALHTTAVRGHINIMKELVEMGASLEAKSNYCKTPLIYASNYGHAHIVNYLINQKASLNVADNEDMTALTWASQDGHVDIVSLLINHGAELEVPNKYGRTPILCAVQSNHFEVTKILLLKGASVKSFDSQGFYCIHQAAYNGNLEILTLLFNKFGVDFQDTSGRTPLIHAAFQGYDNVINALLENGADVNVQDAEGMTALHWASYHSHVNTIQLLLRNRANNYIRDMQGRTPLMYAIVSQHLDTVNLVGTETNINMGSYNNISPLHVAAGLGNVDVVQVLLDKGADINIKSNSLTPIMCAVNNNRTEVVSLLVSVGASTGEGNVMKN